MEEWAEVGAEPDPYDAKDPKGDPLVDALDRIPVDEFDDEYGGSVLPGWDDWNTIPFGTQTGCRPRLLVVIDSDANIAPRLRDTLARLAHCNGTHGAKTGSVMFYLTGFFPSWQSEWIAHRASLEAALGSQKMDAPPIIRISVRGRPQHTFFTSEGRPAGGRDMLDWWRAAEPHLRGCLRRRLDFVRSQRVEQERNCGFVQGYTEQPPEMDRANVLSFGDYRATGANVMDWRLRCYLVPGVPIGFAGRIKLHHPLVHPLALHNPPHLPGDDNSAWVAVDAKRFLRVPGDYLDLGNLP